MENVKLFLSQKSQVDFVETIKSKNRYRTRASFFQSSEDGKQEIFSCGLSMNVACKSSVHWSGSRIQMDRDQF